MANRRRFLTVSAGLGVGAGAAAVRTDAAADEPGTARSRDLYELRRYHLDGPKQKEGLDAFLKDAAIPAWNRQGIAPVGVFHPEKDPSPVFVLLRHGGMEGVVNGTQRLLADPEFLSKGTALLDAPAEAPAFRRIDSSLLLAFRGMPTLETPVKNPGRVLQLRIYESSSVKAGQKKIEMFNDAGEIAIFRRVGLHPVFFGEALAGDRMPNLTYMLAFESRDELDANWKKFRDDPEWQTLSKRAEYADKVILSGITNLILRPAEFSQI
jgi:hypothetical protein